jgi:hypothetical protein
MEVSKEGLMAVYTEGKNLVLLYENGQRLTITCTSVRMANQEYVGRYWIGEHGTAVLNHVVEVRRTFDNC